MKRHIILLLATLIGLPAWAQQTSADVESILLSRQLAEINYTDTTFLVTVKANNEYAVTTEASWLKVSKDGRKASIHAQSNTDVESRTGVVTFTTADGSLKRTLQVVQSGDRSVQDLQTEQQIKVNSVTASSNNTRDAEKPANMIDGNDNTIYHSIYGTGVSQLPVTLTFNFASAADLDYIMYMPRQDGNSNGNWGEFEVQLRRAGSSSFEKVGDYDFLMASSPATVFFSETQREVNAVRIIVRTGAADHVSAAEVQFYHVLEADGDIAIFGDDTWTTLRPGATQADVDAISNSFVKGLAQQLLDGTYDTRFRVTQHECKYSPQKLSDLWNAPGKYYDQVEGVTGIHVPAGAALGVVVSGLPEGLSAQLRIVAWYVGKDGTNFDGGDPHASNYTLHNGLNKISYDFDWDGLAYVNYFSNDNPESKSPITVHFVNAVQNGYLSPDMTNEEMHQLCKNAPNICMDLLGSKVHSVWTSNGLYQYCKTSAGAARGYRQYLNLLDTLVQWEHDLLGFTKYERIPRNHTFAYTNWTYYMFQGGWGVSFIHTQESRVLNCKTLMFNDYDAVWGLSHEWGHQHQMTPYFNWAGMTEVTNNMNSYYNTVHMGYTTGYSHGAEPADGLVLYNGVVKGILSAVDQTVYTTLTQEGGPQTTRKNAYNNRNTYSWNTKLKALCESMSDDSWTDKEKDGPLWFDYTNYGSVRPFVALWQYATSQLGLKDFGPDLYEALRQTDDANGSQVEKQGEVDKYELIASAQNNNKNGKLTDLQSKYPNSTWVTNRYITTAHCDRWENSVPYIMNFVRKASRLTGYNLFPYFEKCGMLRQVALRIYDGHWYLMTQDMYDEFKADMDALGLQECDDAMVKAILTVATPSYGRPTIPN